MPFIHDDFLLHNEAARCLYHEYAANQPILDFHCHLPPQDVAENRIFNNLYEIWLEGDHYKWRAMRANGIAEQYCTGDADPYDKYRAFAQTIPYALRNPLYHWTHLELKRYFGIDDLLNEESAPKIWQQASEQLSSSQFSTHAILTKFQVRAVCTTDDPAESLSHHETIATSSLETRVYPSFRPDRALVVNDPATFNAWVDKLGAAANVDIGSFSDFLTALDKRHQAFHDVGGRVSDHDLPYCYADFCSEDTAAGIFAKARYGTAANPAEHGKFAANMMLYFGQLDAQRGWTKQFHMGVLRNNNTRLLNTIGRDIGCDSIGDFSQGQALAKFLDRLEQEQSLPKLILYNNNPNDNFLFATMAGNFQDGSLPGKIQFGSGWWHLDQKEGMQWQLSALSNVGLLSRFVGMLTDSRSFMSYPRHEYFRRVLCNLLGEEMENGELPNDDSLVGGMVRKICYQNADEYFGLELPKPVSA